MRRWNGNSYLTKSTNVHDAASWLVLLAQSHLQTGKGKKGEEDEEDQKKEKLEEDVLNVEGVANYFTKWYERAIDEMIGDFRIFHESTYMSDERQEEEVEKEEERERKKEKELHYFTMLCKIVLTAVSDCSDDFEDIFFKDNKSKNKNQNGGGGGADAVKLSKIITVSSETMCKKLLHFFKDYFHRAFDLHVPTARVLVLLNMLHKELNGAQKSVKTVSLSEYALDIASHVLDSKIAHTFQHLQEKCLLLVRQCKEALVLLTNNVEKQGSSKGKAKKISLYGRKLCTEVLNTAEESLEQLTPIFDGLEKYQFLVRQLSTVCVKIQIKMQQFLLFLNVLLSDYATQPAKQSYDLPSIRLILILCQLCVHLEQKGILRCRRKLALILRIASERVNDNFVNVRDLRARFNESAKMLLSAFVLLSGHYLGQFLCDGVISLSLYTGAVKEEEKEGIEGKGKEKDVDKASEYIYEFLERIVQVRQEVDVVLTAEDMYRTGSMSDTSGGNRGVEKIERNRASRQQQEEEEEEEGEEDEEEDEEEEEEEEGDDDDNENERDDGERRKKDGMSESGSFNVLQSEGRAGEAKTGKAKRGDEEEGEEEVEEKKKRPLDHRNSNNSLRNSLLIRKVDIFQEIIMEKKAVTVMRNIALFCLFSYTQQIRREAFSLTTYKQGIIDAEYLKHAMSKAVSLSVYADVEEMLRLVMRYFGERCVVENAERAAAISKAAVQKAVRRSTLTAKKRPIMAANSKKY